ncbi:hypothetical protein D9601_16110 [Sphingomonas sp. MA1305]|uniref:hypothetical protein n=1 Tax=Sphingomonas sp. MA1305 TaxID=2479204 RepID=UPI0018DF8499|nr:hypothetical protein [Sphingomonas sp. MA1305]MBI0476877.1 hypothetical protein [Sphingomonas sp. MA1305]
MAQRNWIVALAVIALAGLGYWYAGRRPTSPPRAAADEVPVVAASPAPAAAATVAPRAAPAPSPAAAGVTPQPDDIAATLPPDGISPAQLHARFRAEPRDPAWASRSEAGLRNALAEIPQIGGGNALTVQCASSLCEVSGDYAANLPLADANAVMQALQGETLSRRATALGLDNPTSSFGSAHGRPTFFLVYRRK